MRQQTENRRDTLFELLDSKPIESITYGQTVIVHQDSQSLRAKNGEILNPRLTTADLEELLAEYVGF